MVQFLSLLAREPPSFPPAMMEDFVHALTIDLEEWHDI